MFNDFINAKARPERAIRDQDLWDQVFDIMEDAPDGSVIAQWMPSHLDEIANAQLKQKVLDAGLIDEGDINGNVLADVLAKAGANMHECNAINVQMASDRRVLAILAQKMYLEIWTNFIDCSEAEQKLADLQDQADAANNLADYNPMDDDDQYDYNPFGTEQQTTHVTTGADNTTEATDPTAEQTPSTQATNTLQDLRTRFPNYGWETDDEHKAGEMTATWPSTEDPRKFGKVPI